MLPKSPKTADYSNQNIVLYYNVKYIFMLISNALRLSFLSYRPFFCMFHKEKFNSHEYSVINENITLVKPTKTESYKNK